MNSKRFIRFSLCLTLILLIFVTSIQVAIDPLFQYHKPWLGLKPFIQNERYQDAGMAKTFDYDNVIMGTSMSQNFRINEYETLFGGKTVKLTMEGSHPLDWTFVLNNLRHRETHPKTILLNLDPYVFRADTDKLAHDLPLYLYDYNYLNDVNYLLNFQIINDFAMETVFGNIKHSLPDENEVFVWSDYKKLGAEYVLSQYERPNVVSVPVDSELYTNDAIDNMNLLSPYIAAMPETRFVFFCSPFSMLFWDECMRENSVDAHKQGYISAISKLMNYNNVSVFLWNDEAMLDIMSDLDNYADTSHYSEEVNSLMLQRISKKQGLLTKDNYIIEVDKLFEYINSFNYNELFA